MIFATSRFKLKLWPPKRLIYYSPCLSILFAILLIAQLRALEVAPQQKSSRSTPDARLPESHVPPQLPADGATIRGSNGSETSSGPAATQTAISSPAQPAESIDRDDRPDGYEEPTDLAGLVNETRAHSPRVEAAAQPVVDLATSPSTDELSSGDPRALAPDSRAGPSLAELTAAGTAAGLLIHDMMAQANMVNQMPYEAQVQDSQPAIAGGEDELGAWPQQVAAARRDSMGNAALQTRQLHLTSDLASAPEPPGENQMPDSIESLMGADGPPDASDEDGERGQANDYRPQQAAYEGNEGVPQDGGGLLPQQAMQQARSVDAGAGASDDDDDDGEDDAADDAQDGAGARARAAAAAAVLEQAGSQLHGHNRPVPVLMSSPRYDAPLDSYGPDQADLLAAAKFGGEHEQSALVAPMRDSLVDLNAAAGHYYGKKKKKKKMKVKKIVLKKKKKKVKIIKIKRKKKKVKKKKPKKQHHHVHDHGKYYMYAKVPKKKSWEFGYKKGNKKHWIERHEKGHKNKFKTKVKWYDKKSKGKGVHIWDYNHHDKKKKKHH